MNYKLEYIIFASDYTTSPDGGPARLVGSVSIKSGMLSLLLSLSLPLDPLHLQQVPHDLHATHGGQILPTAHRCPHDIFFLEKALLY